MTVKFRRHPWDPDEIVEVEIDPTGFQSYNVRIDGKWIGEVGYYEGSLDRKIGRLRWPGKRRRLWSSRRPGQRSLYDHVSRAEAIRDLIAGQENRP